MMHVVMTKKPLKIAYIITRMDEYGGAQVHVRDMTTTLKNQGHAPLVISGWPGKVSDYLEHMGIDFRDVPDLMRSIHPVKDLKAFFQIRKILKQEKPDLVSCHSSKAGLLGRMAAFSCRIPVIFTAHGWAFTENVPPKQRALYKIIEKVAAFLASHIITVSKYDRDLALKNNIAPADKITAIHNGMPEIAVPDRAPLPNDGAVHIMMVARFGPQKDHANLLKALSKLTDYNWKLFFVGGGDNSETVALSDALGLESHVHFMGEREDIPDLMRKADIYALISHWEGFPRSILEAMRSALPVIATDIAGVSESVLDGKTGYLVKHGDPEDVARALRAYFENRKDIQKMGRAGRKRYEENFTFAHMMDETQRVYQNVLAKK
ncbi:MAG: glycosyl transferase family 1 [Micavibrio sp.]|nr:glycosyl transferase family 1 [Micavibrio sp.]|tara:strand:- start:660864 stop:661997 length:1134 start_codon:yes stop_codon:yes gene_type:complete